MQKSSLSLYVSKEGIIISRDSQENVDDDMPNYGNVSKRQVTVCLKGTPQAKFHCTTFQLSLDLHLLHNFFSRCG